MRLPIAALALLTATVAQAAVTIEQAGRYRSGARSGTEIVVVHATSKRAYLSNSSEGWVDVLTLDKPGSPKQLVRLAVPLAKGEDLTSIAVHPGGEYFAAVVEVEDASGAGRVELRSTRDGTLIKTVPVRPDAGVVTAEFKRSLERKVDVNGDGKATAPADLNRDGDIDDDRVAVGTLGGVTVFTDEASGEQFMLPIGGATPDLLEPESIAIAPDSARAFVTLQESNAVVVIDLVGGRVERAFGLGLAEHAADLVEDDQARFTDTLRALREPDGAALIADGRFLVTADEGDTEPKLSMVAAGTVVGGGRTLSVFEAATGRLVSDTGGQLDAFTAERGFYPDSRSTAKGSEPEMVVAFVIEGVQYAAVSLERANGVAVISLADPTRPDPTRPVVVGAASADRTAKAGAVGPEGIAYYSADGWHYLMTANEKDGSLSVYRVDFGR